VLVLSVFSRSRFIPFYSARQAASLRALGVFTRDRFFPRHDLCYKNFSEALIIAIEHWKANDLTFCMRGIPGYLLPLYRPGIFL